MKENENFDADEMLHESCVEAQELMKDPGKVDRLLKKLERKLKKGPRLLKALARIPQMGMLVNSYIHGEYTEIPIGILVAIIGVLLYFVAPADAIPDFIPFIGLVDDAAVAGAALYLIQSDLDDYMNWRVCNGLDTGRTIIQVEAALE